MNKVYRLQWILLLSLFLSPLAYASEAYPDVAMWTQNTMLKTLSADYLNNPKALEKIKKCYYPAAWATLTSFFYQRLQELRAKNIVLHPYPLTPPTIVSAGNCARFKCWRIEQTYRVPELQKDGAFSILVIDGKDFSADSPFLIESLNFSGSSY
jgi:hypothetical protein